MEKASILLLDEEFTRWTVPELAKWLNEGVSAICLAKPSAYSETACIPLVEGTLQALPDSARSLLRIVRNLKSQTPRVGGRIISPTTSTVLDAADPYWHDGERSTFKPEVRNFVYSGDDPRSFYVYPGNDGTGLVEAVLAQLPPRVEPSGDAGALASYTGEVGLDDIYEMPLTDFICFRAQSKDDEGAVMGRAVAHYQQFANAVGLRVQNQAEFSPTRQRERS